MSRVRYMGICRKSGKRIYREALDVLLDHQRNPRKIRAYKCPHGEHYHATSKPPRQET